MAEQVIAMESLAVTAVFSLGLVMVACSQSIKTGCVYQYWMHHVQQSCQTKQLSINHSSMILVLYMHYVADLH